MNLNDILSRFDGNVSKCGAHLLYASLEAGSDGDVGRDEVEGRDAAEVHVLDGGKGHICKSQISNNWRDY